MELTFPLSDSIVNEFKKKMSEGQQLAKDDSLTSPDEAQVEATLLKLVGGYIKDENVSLKDITSFLSSNVTGSEYGRMVLTDALWFWGTQVELLRGNEKLTSICLESFYCYQLIIFVNVFFFATRHLQLRMKKMVKFAISGVVFVDSSKSWGPPEFWMYHK